MNKVELIHFSLASAFEILESLVSDLTQEQADWMPPGTANPIGVLYWHTISYVDQIVHEWCMPPYKQMTIEEWSAAKSAGRDLGMGQVPLRYSAGWQEKVVIALPPENPEDPYWEVRAAREGLRVDLPMLHDYAQATKQTLLSWVASLTPGDLERSIPTPIGEFNMDQLLESFIIGHINNHSGEISALKGCQGIKGYPW
ncbi:MAG: DinB family protein [Anaerolineae bacterium]|jgi:hypothetical protein